MVVLIPFFSAIAPFLLWPIELFFPYPYILEELAKTVLVYFILREDPKRSFIMVVIMGAFFALSESVLYLANITLTGTITTVIIRLVLTLPFHIFTSLIILSLAKYNKRLWPVGIVLAMIFHYIYNISIINTL